MLYYYMLDLFHLSYILLFHHYLLYYKLSLNNFMKNMHSSDYMSVLLVLSVRLIRESGRALIAVFLTFLFSLWLLSDLYWVIYDAAGAVVSK